MDYFPYGKVSREYIDGQFPDRFLTTYHERDHGTGLDYRGARFYDSDIGRFLSLDPLARDFAAWSPYNYVLGNPIIFVDPTGKAPEWCPPCAAAAAAFLKGAAVEAGSQYLVNRYNGQSRLEAVKNIDLVDAGTAGVQDVATGGFGGVLKIGKKVNLLINGASEVTQAAADGSINGGLDIINTGDSEKTLTGVATDVGVSVVAGKVGEVAEFTTKTITEGALKKQISKADIWKKNAMVGSKHKSDATGVGADLRKTMKQNAKVSAVVGHGTGEAVENEINQ